MGCFYFLDIMLEMMYICIALALHLQCIYVLHNDIKEMGVMKKGLNALRKPIKWLVALFSILISISACGKSSIEIVEAEPITLKMPEETGASVQVEYAGKEKVIVKKEDTFQVATNFRASAFSDDVEPAVKKSCKRYATLYETLKDGNGSISDDVNDQKALKLLKDVGQPFLTWSTVYNQSSGEITIATKTNHKYNAPHCFTMPKSQIQQLIHLAL